MRTRESGLTLIEVIVAIAIFAVLGVISYRAVSTMSDSRVRVEAELSRWRAISRIMQLVDNDLTQLAPRPTGTGNAIPTEAALTLVKGTDRDELRLVRHDGANGGLQHRAYHLDGGKLILVRWSPRDSSSTQDVLLDGVKSVRWHFLTSNGQVLDGWPTADPLAQNTLPAGMRMDLELTDAGLVSRVFSIR